MKDTKQILIAIIVVVALVLGYSAMTTRENRTVGEKVDAAVGQLDNGVDNAARELKDRTPAEKVGDAIEDATDKNH